MASRIHFGAVDPYTLTYVATSTDFDLSTTSSATFRVRRPDGTLLFWVAVVSGATPSQVTLTHVFGAGDLGIIGNHEVYADIELAGPVTVQTEHFLLVVFDPYTGGT